MLTFTYATAVLLVLLSASVGTATEESPAHAVIASGAEFAAALLDTRVTHIYVNITEDLRLKDADFPSEAVLVTRNLTVEGIQTGPDKWPMVDLRDAYHRASTRGIRLAGDRPCDGAPRQTAGGYAVSYAV